MSEKALTVRDQMTLAETMTLGETMAASGFFDDAKEAAQAVVKILAGRELGFGPVASMTGIYIVRKRVCLSANLMAAAVKRDARYNYKVVEHDAGICSIVFFEGGEIVGTSTFTREDAAKAGLGGDNWRKYPRNMLFARAMSNGARWFCPDAFGGGPVYTPEELGATVDESGDVLDVPIRDVTPEQRATTDDSAELAEARRETEELMTYPGDNIPDGPDVRPGPPTAKRSWPAGIVKPLVDAGLADNPPNATHMLNLSDILRTTDELELVMTWANHYRNQRPPVGDKEPEEAARYADAQLEGIEEQTGKEGE